MFVEVVGEVVEYVMYVIVGGLWWCFGCIVGCEYVVWYWVVGFVC